MISKVELRELAKQGIFRPAGSCGRYDRPGDKKRQSPGKHPSARTHRLGSFIELELYLIRHNVLDELPSE